VKVRYPFLYLVLASTLLAALLLFFGGARKRHSLPATVLSRDKVALVDVSGVITSSQSAPRGVTGTRDLLRELKKHGDDDSVRAVVLRIDSPGGTVVAAQEIYSALRRLRDEKGKVVVASMADVSASGGYYIACAADHIVANPGTITGSIGVIMKFPNLEGLFGKVGIRTITIKSGKFKDTGNSSREMTEEERSVLQSLLDDVHRQFIEDVAAGRGMTIEEVTPLADGRIFTGRRARELGLVDETGDLRSAVLKAAELAGIEGEPSIVSEKRKIRFWELLESRLAGLLPLSSADRPSLNGRLLYLWQ
jgi:protease-4